DTVIVRILTVIIVASLFSSPWLLADEGSSRSIRIVGKQQATVTSDVVQLADIARISSRFVRDDEKIISLGKIEVAQAPLPGKPLSLSASQVLEVMRSEGIDLDSVGYRFPRVITVSRAARNLSRQEVQMGLEEAIQLNSE